MAITLSPEQQTELERALRLDFTKSPDLITNVTTFFADMDAAATTGGSVDEENFFQSFRNLQTVLNKWLDAATNDNERDLIKSAFYQQLKGTLEKVMNDNNTLVTQVKSLGKANETFKTASREPMDKAGSLISKWNDYFPATEKFNTNDLNDIKTGVQGIIGGFTDLSYDSSTGGVNNAYDRIRVIKSHIEAVRSHVNSHSYTEKTPDPSLQKSAQQAFVNKEAKRQKEAADIKEKLVSQLQVLEASLDTLGEKMVNNGITNTETLTSLSTQAEILQRISDDYPLDGSDKITDSEEMYEHMFVDQIDDSYSLPYRLTLPRKNPAIGGSDPYAPDTICSDDDNMRYYTWAVLNKDSKDKIDIHQKEAIDANAKAVFDNKIDISQILTLMGGSPASMSYEDANMRVRPAVEQYLNHPTWGGESRPGHPDDESNYFLPLLAWHFDIKENLTNNQRKDHVINALVNQTLNHVNSVPVNPEKYSQDVEAARTHFVERTRRLFSSTTTREEARANYNSAVIRQIHKETANEFANVDITQNNSNRETFVMNLTNRIMQKRIELVQEHVNQRRTNVFAKFVRNYRSHPLKVMLGSAVVAGGIIGAGALGLAMGPIATGLAIGGSAKIFGTSMIKYLGNKFGVQKERSKNGLLPGSLAPIGSANALSEADTNTALTRQIMMADEINANASTDDEGNLVLDAKDTDYGGQLKTATTLFSRSKDHVTQQITDSINNSINSGVTDSSSIALEAVTTLYSTGGLEDDFAQGLRSAKMRSEHLDFAGYAMAGGAGLAGAFMLGI